MRSRSALYLLTTFVALATGLALLGAALTIGAARVADPRDAATEAVVRAFYAAINDTIRTGVPTGLDEIVAADFVSHTPLPGVSPDRAGLARYLMALHATGPSIEFFVQEVTIVGDRALARLTVTGGEERMFLGMPLRRGPPVWGSVGAVRVAGRWVAEHWGDMPGLALLEPSARATFGAPAADDPFLSLDRLTIPVHGSFAAVGRSETRLLVVEAGAIDVTSTPLSIAPSMNQGLAVETMKPDTGRPVSLTPAPLTAGNTLVLPPSSRTEVRNAGPAPVSLLVIATSPVAAVSHWEQNPTSAQGMPRAAPSTGGAPWPFGVAGTYANGGFVIPLAGFGVAALPAGPAVISTGRVTLAPGADLTVQLTDGPSLLAVEQGVLNLIAAGNKAWVHRGTDGTIESLAAGTLAMGDGAQFHAGTMVTLSNAGAEPVVITIVAILPDDAGTA